MTANPRYACTTPGCGMKNTRKQLRINNGICPHCKTAMSHKDWMGQHTATIAQVLSLPKADEISVGDIAEIVGISRVDLINLAVQEKIRVWTSDPNNIEAAVKQDLMLAKLYRR
jgi:hypothetical protein